MREFCPKATFGSRFRQVAYSKQVAGKNPAIWKKKTGFRVQGSGFEIWGKRQKGQKGRKGQKRFENPEPGSAEPGTLTGITH